MELLEMLKRAKKGDMQALQEIINYFEPFLNSLSDKDGIIDEELHQDLIQVLEKFIKDYPL